jgi:soluble lytic murein transglycosylase-like protein
VNVTVPLRLPLQKIERDIKEQLFNGPDGTCVLVADERACRRFYLSGPQVSARGKLLRITCDVQVLYGGKEGPACADAQRWQGQAELAAQPLIDDARRLLTLQVLEVSFADQGRKTVSVPELGDAAARLVTDRFAKAAVDCGPLVDRIAGLLAVLLPGGRARVDQALRSVSLAQPRVFMFSVAMKMSMPIESLPAAPRAPAERVRAAREERLQRWDAFVTFVSKRLGRNRPQEQRQQVSNVLLDARYELAGAEENLTRSSADPVPGLLVRTWKGMRPVAVELSREPAAAAGSDLENFIAAGNVLAALSAQEKALNYQVTDEGLRAVAGIADPETKEDPLAYGTEVDPELRRLFGFGDPLPQPVIAPVMAIQHDSHGTQTILRLLDSMIPRAWLPASAWAAEEPDPVTKLNAWVPQKSELTAYLEMVKTLLVNLGEEALAKHPLSDPYAQVYRDLVLATAWQESCWRQFIRKEDAIIPLVSSANSVGLMQVNPRVWRGVYDVEGLYGDIRYNGRAGCEILLHYLRDYAIAKGEDKLDGGIDNLPRATYAIYNGGPGHRARYRSSTTSSSLKKIDAALWQKYTAVRAGKEMEVANCYQ